MLKRLLTALLASIAIIACVCVPVYASERSDIIECPFVSISGSGFVVDSLNGVDAIYNDSSKNRHCFEYVYRYYKEIFGVTLYQRADGPVANLAPDGVSVEKTSDEPAEGDIVFWPSYLRARPYSHTAIVKSYEDGVITLIEQNWSSGGKCAFERKIVWPSESYYIFTLKDETGVSQAKLEVVKAKLNFTENASELASEFYGVVAAEQ